MQRLAVTRMLEIAYTARTYGRSTQSRRAHRHVKGGSQNAAELRGARRGTSCNACRRPASGGAAARPPLAQLSADGPLPAIRRRSLPPLEGPPWGKPTRVYAQPSAIVGTGVGMDLRRGANLLI